MKRWMRLTAVALCLLLGACPALGEAITPLPEAEMVEQFPAELEPAARIGLVVNSTPSNVDAILTRLGAEAICQQQKYLTKANLKKWQNRGLLVGSWTLDEPGDIDRWLSLDVDLITSNYPRRVTEAME